MEIRTTSFYSRSKLISSKSTLSHKTTKRHHVDKEEKISIVEHEEVVLIENSLSIRRKKVENELKKAISTNRRLIVLFCYILASQSPQVFLLLVSLLNFDFYFEVYKPLGDLLDILILVTYSVGFTFYCSKNRIL